MIRSVASDPSLAFILRTVVARAERIGASAEAAQQMFDAVCSLYEEANGRINPDKNPFPRPEGWLPYEFPRAPGLRLRWGTLDDLQPIRNYFAKVQSSSTASLTALTNSLYWPLIWEWNGEILQYEYVSPGSKTELWGSAFHFSRERPAWFWRELEKPLWKKAAELGFRSLLSFVHRENAWRIELLKGQHDGRLVEDCYNVLFPLDLKVFKGWPSRRTAGPGWKWTKGSVTIRELRPSETSAFKQRLTELWADDYSQRLPLILRLLNDQCGLDQATVLVAEVNGDITYAFAYRPRKPRVANVLTLAHVEDPRVHTLIRLVCQGTQEWLRTVGYSQLTAFVPAELYNHEYFLQRYGQHAGYRPIARYIYSGKTYVEIGVDLVATAQRSDAEWAEWVERPPLPELEAIPLA